MNSQPTETPTTSAWSMLQRGADAEAFAEVFRAHHQAVYNYAFRRLANWTLAEEITCATAWPCGVVPDADVSSPYVPARWLRCCSRWPGRNA